MHFLKMGLPMKPSILVQKQSKEEMATSLGDNIKAEDYQKKQTYEPVNARETNHEVTCSLSGVAQGLSLIGEESRHVGVIRS